MIGVHLDLVRLEEDLHPFHEPARIVEPLGQRLQVLQERRAVHPRLPRHLVDRVGTVVGQRRDQVQDPPELQRGAHRA